MLIVSIKPIIVMSVVIQSVMLTLKGALHSGGLQPYLPTWYKILSSCEGHALSRNVKTKKKWFKTSEKYVAENKRKENSKGDKIKQVNSFLPSSKLVAKVFQNLRP